MFTNRDGNFTTVLDWYGHEMTEVRKSGRVEFGPKNVDRKDVRVLEGEGMRIKL